MYVSLSFDRPEEINKSYIYIQCNSPKCIILILLMIMLYMNFPPLFPTFFLCVCFCLHAVIFFTAFAGTSLHLLACCCHRQISGILCNCFITCVHMCYQHLKKWQIHKTSDALIHFLPFLFGFPTIYTANPAWMC